MVIGATFGVVRNVIFIHLKVPTRSTKKLKKKKKHNTLNDAVLTNSYILVRFDLGFVNFQFDPYSSDFVLFTLNFPLSF
jgi:hypothetical protein